MSKKKLLILFTIMQTLILNANSTQEYLQMQELLITKCSETNSSISRAFNIQDKSYTGDIHCQGDLRHQLNALKIIKRIKGDLILDSSIPIENMEQFSLRQVDGDLYLYGFRTLEGFSSLQWVEGNFDLSNNKQLGNLTGLSTLESVGGDFHLKDMNLEKSGLQSLIKLKRVGGTLDISWNDNLYWIKNGLINLESIGGNFYLMGSNIENINGLQNLKNIGGDLDYSFNFELRNVKSKLKSLQRNHVQGEVYHDSKNSLE